MLLASKWYPSLPGPSITGSRAIPAGALLPAPALLLLPSPVWTGSVCPPWQLHRGYTTGAAPLLPVALQVLPTALAATPPPAPFALCRQAYKRDIVAVANAATLELAVRDCAADGADKVGGCVGGMEEGADKAGVVVWRRGQARQ